MATLGTFNWDNATVTTEIINGATFRVYRLWAKNKGAGKPRRLLDQRRVKVAGKALTTMRHTGLWQALNLG